MEQQARPRHVAHVLIWLNGFTVAFAICALGSIWSLSVFVVDGNVAAAVFGGLAALVSVGLFLVAREHVVDHLERSCAKCRRTFSRRSHPGSAAYLCAWCFGRLRS